MNTKSRYQTHDFFLSHVSNSISNIFCCNYKISSASSSNELDPRFINELHRKTDKSITISHTLNIYIDSDATLDKVSTLSSL